MTRGDQALETAAEKLEALAQKASPPKPEKQGGGPSPWLVLGAALAVGIVAAKVLDWRGHAHPRW